MKLGSALININLERKMPLDFQGRVAIVTGGRQGIGRAIAMTLAQQGAEVVIADRQSEIGAQTAAEIHAATGRKVLHFPVDVREASSVKAMVESALRHIRLLEDHGFDLIKVSLKSSDVLHTIASYRLLSERTDYPLHLGVTEAGTPREGTIKSALGIGILLFEGIGDTIRVSLTSRPEEEIPVAYGILRALKLRSRGVEMVSCPTCGRTELDLIPLVEEAERLLQPIRTPIKVAIMGCVVNGPGEAREADVGIAGGRGKGLLFKKGGHTQAFKESELLDRLLDEVERMTGERIPHRPGRQP